MIIKKGTTEGISQLRSLRYQPESGACIDSDLPKASSALEVSLQASIAQQGLNSAGAMDEEAEGMALKSKEGVEYRGTHAREPGVAWVDEAIEPLRLGCRGSDQAGHIMIAANDAIQRDDSGWQDGGGQVDKVAMQTGHSVAVPAPRPLIGSGGKEGSGSLHCGSTARSGAEQIERDGTDAAANIEEGRVLDACGAQCIEQDASVPSGAFALVRFEVARDPALVEPFLDPLASTAVHHILPSVFFFIASLIAAYNPSAYLFQVWKRPRTTPNAFSSLEVHTTNHLYSQWELPQVAPF
jgi:hypothetical protein